MKVDASLSMLAYALSYQVGPAGLASTAARVSLAGLGFCKEKQSKCFAKPVLVLGHLGQPLLEGTPCRFW